MEWYEKAASQGDADALSNIGHLYFSGYGVPQDYSQAMEWFQKAADQGETKAQICLGLMHECGLGVSEDKEKAIEWFRKAMVAGDDRAKPHLDKLEPQQERKDNGQKAKKKLELFKRLFIRK
jgi:TPR repeat protein